MSTNLATGTFGNGFARRESGAAKEFGVTAKIDRTLARMDLFNLTCITDVMQEACAKDSHRRQQPDFRLVAGQPPQCGDGPDRYAEPDLK